MLSLVQKLIRAYEEAYPHNRVCIVSDGYIIRTTEANHHIRTRSELSETLRQELKEVTAECSR